MGNLEVLILLACAISGNLASTACIKGIAPKPVSKQECAVAKKEWESTPTTTYKSDGSKMRFIAECVPAGKRA